MMMGDYGSMITRGDTAPLAPQQTVRIRRSSKPLKGKRATKAQKSRRPRTGAKGR